MLSGRPNNQLHSEGLHVLVPSSKNGAKKKGGNKEEIGSDAFSDIFEECRINKPPRQLYEALCALP